MQYELESVMHFNQGKARTLQRVVLTSTESRSGELTGFQSTLQVGPVATLHQGSVVNTVDGTKILEIEMVRGSRKSSWSVQWAPPTRGLFAVEQSLRGKPLKLKGERRSIAMLLPSHFGIAKARLTCLGMGLSPLLDGQSALLTEIENQIELEDGTVTTMFLWTDEDGRVVRTLSPLLGLNTYRVDEATATKFVRDQPAGVVLPVEGDIKTPAKAKRIAYEISILDRYAHLKTAESAGKRAKSEAPEPLETESLETQGKGDKAVDSGQDQKLVEILPAPGQFVREVGAGKYQLVVTRSGERTRNGFDHVDLQPVDEDTTTNHFVDFSNTLVRRFADAAVVSTAGKSDAEVAQTLAGTMKSLIQFEPTMVGLQRASDVARDGKGGQTGQAVLLTAMLRAKKIPARIAIGLKYEDDPSQNGRDQLRDGVWVLFHTGEEWIHLDPQTGQFAPPDRIVLSTTTLAGNQQDKVFVPFLDAVTRIQVRAIKAQY